MLLRSLSAALLLSAAHAAAAQSPVTEDIYVLRGDINQLRAFHEKIGKDWVGGKFLDRLSSDTEYRYWAYAHRTAPQARAFMFGSINEGVKLDFETYQEKSYYPTERTLLDGVILRCGLKSNPFFIEPDRVIRVAPQVAEGKCVAGELSKASAADPMRMNLVPTPAERG